MAVKLFIKSIILFALILIISYLAMFLNPDYKIEYIAGVAPKLEKLKMTQGSKIVIIGGSNGSFGIDSSLMEKELGVPVVNMALHGGLPLKYTIEQVKGYLRKGDVLILTKEYGGLRNQYWNKMNGVELPKIITYDFSQIGALLNDKILLKSTFSGLFKTINHNIKRFPSKAKKDRNSVYSIKAFDGDNLKSERLMGTYEKEVTEHKLPKLTEKSSLIKNLQDYSKYFNKKGIEFYITPPVIVEGYYDMKEILPFWRFFSSSARIPLLNETKSYVYPREYFFNSHYHTNQLGREIRTISLIDDIKSRGVQILN
ncbi:hypothetical protein [Flagellimonas sp.]|uniref:hypothetical protein n=1 Tax=Flagellimonas sp. TaxID=2058762 RepID=UPI003B5CB474